ncbi:uncharacterized protein F4812DRAFT_454653 [Daldinia caldariorum]|uniref:uncharacterized protein n=1 Tax=Daldinia caldariorum TaxID=326644 RepID=UPI0020076A31|nr:uncharacterized protein F4812DRAFT_454653 [Daldinia caldariorum]KAI1472835.1 hypothetical protein F4812DRAFT_454653 [Daldinia caldariorum]
MGTFDDSKSSVLTRGSSLRASARLSTSQGDDDDYDLQAMAVADGFHPVVDATNTQIPRSATTPQDVPMAQIPPPRPSSITKPRRWSGSLALQNDGSPSESDSGRSLSRVSSGSTVSPFVDSEDPYDGPSGPSHPYQMYPQDVRVVRTASLATTSTAPVSERSYNGPRGPAHPYGMYPQNTVPTAETGGISSRPVQADINVGFPGTTDNYQRRIGPDGEDVADLIGPDGHTEQLPPYTRYPEEAYTRKALGVELRPAPVQPMLAIPGAGGIGMATRNPEFASTEDLGRLSSPQSRQSIRSFASETSRNELNTTTTHDTTHDSEIIEEKESPKGWHFTAKRRVWGIVPCWAIVLAAIVLVLMGVILGAVIGTLLRSASKNKSHQDKPHLPIMNPGNWDTEPLSTLPSDLPPLQEGDFSLPLRNSRMSNTCFSDSTLAQAWNCDLFFFQLGMKIRRIPGQPETSDYSLQFSYNDSATLHNNMYLWGMQPPELTDVRLKLVNDLRESPRGPAWNFEVAYNKTVIVPDQALTTNTSSSSSIKNRRRTLYGGGPNRKGAQVGDRIWICHWDNTILEAFIYANQSNSIRPMTSPPLPATTVGISSGLTTTSSAAVTGPPGEIIENGGELRPSDIFNGGPQDHHATTASSDSTPNPTITSSTPTPSGISDQDFPMPKNYPPVYPRVIKVEEHRNTGPSIPKPWCRQFQINSDNRAEAVKVNGKDVDIIIDEDEGEFGPGPLKDIIIERHLEDGRSIKMGSDISDCGCMWWLS